MWNFLFVYIENSIYLTRFMKQLLFSNKIANNMEKGHFFFFRSSSFSSFKKNYVFLDGEVVWSHFHCYFFFYFSIFCRPIWCFRQDVPFFQYTESIKEICYKILHGTIFEAIMSFTLHWTPAKVNEVKFCILFYVDNFDKQYISMKKKEPEKVKEEKRVAKKLT